MGKEKSLFLKKLGKKVSTISKHEQLGVILNTNNPINKNYPVLSRNIAFKARNRVFLSDSKQKDCESLISKLSLRNNSKFKEFKRNNQNPTKNSNF